MLALFVGGVNDDGQHHAQRVDNIVLLAAEHLFPRIKSSALTTNIRRFLRLSVDDRRRRRWPFVGGFADLLAERIVHALSRSVMSPSPKQGADRAPPRKVVWQRTPRSASAIDVKNRIDNFPPTDGSGPPAFASCRQMFLIQLPLFVGQIRVILRATRCYGYRSLLGCFSKTGAAPFSTIQSI